MSRECKFTCKMCNSLATPGLGTGLSATAVTAPNPAGGRIVPPEGLRIPAGILGQSGSQSLSQSSLG